MVKKEWRGRASDRVIVVEDAALHQQHSPALEALVLDERYSWVRQRGLHASREHDSIHLYHLLFWAFDLVAVWGCLKYWVWFLLKRPKGRDQLGLGILGTVFFGGVHPLLKIAHEGVTSWTALAVLYAAPLVGKHKTGWRWAVFRLWMGHPECQAVRNRLLDVADRVHDELERLWATRRDQEIHIASLACGSAAAVLWATWYFCQARPTARVRVTLVDLDAYSLEMANRLAAELGLSVRTLEVNIGVFIRQCQASGEKFALIDETGFLDYRPDAAFVENCRTVRQIIEPGGLFLAAQIGHSRTQAHRKWTIGWLMLIPRSSKRLRELLEQSGYAQAQIDEGTEPNGIYHLAACRVAACQAE